MRTTSQIPSTDVVGACKKLCAPTLHGRSPPLLAVIIHYIDTMGGTKCSHSFSGRLSLVLQVRYFSKRRGKSIMRKSNKHGRQSVSASKRSSHACTYQIESPPKFGCGYSPTKLCDTTNGCAQCAFIPNDTVWLCAECSGPQTGLTMLPIYTEGHCALCNRHSFLLIGAMYVVR